MASEYESKRWAYAPLVAWLDESRYSNTLEDRTWVHCDQLTLHRRGECAYCDEYGAEAQTRRLLRRIPFSGEPGAPDALFRPDETVKRWVGNRPVAHTAVMVGDATLTANGLTVPGGYTLVKAPTPMCFGDGSQFCCARNGCHAVCNCTVKPQRPEAIP